MMRWGGRGLVTTRQCQGRRAAGAVFHHSGSVAITHGWPSVESVPGHGLHVTQNTELVTIWSMGAEVTYTGRGALTEAWHYYECDQHNVMTAPWLFLWRQCTQATFNNHGYHIMRIYYLPSCNDGSAYCTVSKYPNILASWVCSTHLIVWWEMKSTWLQSHWVPGTALSQGRAPGDGQWATGPCETFIAVWEWETHFDIYDQAHWEYNLLNINLKVIKN